MLSKAELERKWWHRLFKVLRAVAVAVLFVWALGEVVTAIRSAALTQVVRISLTQWAANQIRATRGEQIVLTEPFANPNQSGAYMGCEIGGQIAGLAGPLTDRATNCALADDDTNAQIEFLQKMFPEYRAYAGDGVVCLIPRGTCDAGRIVRYDFEPVYTRLHYVGMLAIPSGVVALMLGVLNVFYYRVVLYVAFGRDVPPAASV